MVTYLDIFITILASTPNVGGAGLDLIIILACLSALVSMVYLFKYLLEKYKIARNKTVLQNNANDLPENLRS